MKQFDGEEFFNCDILIEVLKSKNVVLCQQTVKKFKGFFWCRKEFIAVRKHRADELDCLAVYPAEGECLKIKMKNIYQFDLKI